MTPSVHVKGLTKSYGAFHAVKGVDFDIFPGEVFGLLGPGTTRRAFPRASERISSVVFKGERVRRVDLFDAAKNPFE
jgi:ABC-type phosphonate transport system ATPase subunit